MAKLLDNKTVKIIDTGNFNTLVKNWYSAEDNSQLIDLDLENDEIVNIKVYEDHTVPGGVYTLVTKTTKHYTTTLGSILHDRNAPEYDMKKDKHRIEFSTKLK